MSAFASWTEDHSPLSVEALDIPRLWDEIEAGTKQPVVLRLEAEGAEASAVICDATGTTVVYFPAGYAEAGVGSLQSVGDPAGAERDAWHPPLTAYYFSHHTEFPRWSVVSHDEGRRALAEFCSRPGVPPPSIAWRED
jgi:Immunity protein Imm1